MDPEKDLAQKIQVTGKPVEGGLALGFGEADLDPPGEYQLNVGVEMRSRWPDLQTQVRKFQEKSDLEKSKSVEGG